jgi:hypothetical protein
MRGGLRGRTAMAPPRLRLGELMYAGIGGRDTPMQIGLLCVFDVGPFRSADATLDVARIRTDDTETAEQP